MILIADTSPLNYLVQIDQVDIVERLYSHVIIPDGVYRELTAPQTHQKVRALLLAQPEWLEVRLLAGPLDPTLQYLGPGEQEAIQLAEQLRADAILIDDKQGRGSQAESGRHWNSRRSGSCCREKFSRLARSHRSPATDQFPHFSSDPRSTLEALWPVRTGRVGRHKQHLDLPAPSLFSWAGNLFTDTSLARNAASFEQASFRELTLAAER